MTSDHPGDASESPSHLGVRRALLIFLVFYLMELNVGIIMGVLSGLYFTIMRGTTGPEVAADAQRAVVVPAALAGTALAGFAVLGMTRRSLPGALNSGALLPIGWSKALPRHLATGAILGVALAVVYLLLLVPTFPPDPSQRWGSFVHAAQSRGWPRHAWALCVLIVAPPVEEFVFRGVLFHGFSRSWGPGLSGSLVTALFVGAHVSEIFAYWPAVVAIALVGVATLIVRIIANSLAPAILLHAAYNSVMVLAVYAGGA